MNIFNNFSIFALASTRVLSTYWSVIETSRSVKFSQNLSGLRGVATTLTSWFISSSIQGDNIFLYDVGTVAYLRPQAMREA